MKIDIDEATLQMTVAGLFLIFLFNLAIGCDKENKIQNRLDKQLQLAHPTPAPVKP